MKALIIYDSVWGNTEKIAQTIASSLAHRGDVKTVRAAEAKPADIAGMDHVIVGSPTQKFAALPAVRKFFAGLPAGALKGIRVAAFDTRLDVAKSKSRLLKFLAGKFGYAAGKLAKILVTKGGSEAVAAEGFFVEGTEGPLKEGELDRAAAWAGRIAG